MSRWAVSLALLATACVSTPKPVVTGAGVSADGQQAWFAVTRGEALIIYRCEDRGCHVVPRSDEPARRMPPASAAREPEPEEAPPEEVDESPPEEERLDMMDGVL